MKVQLILNVPKLKTTQEGQVYCSLLVNQIVHSTVNDDHSIVSIESRVPKKG